MESKPNSSEVDIYFAPVHSIFCGYQARRVGPRPTKYLAQLFVRLLCRNDEKRHLCHK
jgi:hypothetical protein